MKQCSKCKETKPKSKFGKRKTSTDGFDSWCKSCKRVANRKYKQKNKEHLKEYQKQYRQKNKSKLREKALEKRVDTIKERKARHKLENEVRYGRIIPPNICSNPDCKGKSKRIVGHHEDYNKPLQVEWLCHDCHMNLHADKREKGVV